MINYDKGKHCYVFLIPYSKIFVTTSWRPLRKLFAPLRLIIY